MNTTLVWLMILSAAVCGYVMFKLWDWRDKARTPPQHVAVDYAKFAREKNLGPREFVLTDQDGNLFTSDELRGKVWVLSFFYSTCGKECRELNKKLAEIQKEIPDPDLHLVSISCTPELDTPLVLQGYLPQFGGNPLKWHMLTGNYNYIHDKIAQPVQVTYERGDHTQRVVIIGRDGLPKDYVSLLVNGEADKAKERIRKLLAEPIPEKNPTEQKELKPAEPVEKQTRRDSSARQLAEVAR